MTTAIDIGGTKTLICTLSDDLKIVNSTKFPTPQEYTEFKSQLTNALAQYNSHEAHTVVVGAPGVLNRKEGIAVAFGNLPWKNVPLVNDIQTVCQKPVYIENDAKLAGLYEAYTLKESYKRVLYVTISTGIGIALVANGVLDQNVSDAGGKGIIIDHDGELFPWERYASGKAIFNEFGQRASDITDPAIWQEVARRLVPGFTSLITLLSPDVITIGGGVGAHYEKFADIFESLLQSYIIEGVTMPKIVKAQDAEEAVILGAGVLAKQYA